jgi:SpoVK/Ycf46/Vps4 family AAA+-type ATPase
LREILYNENINREYILKYKKSIKVPYDSIRGIPLAEIKEFNRNWSDIIIDDINKNCLEKIIQENIMKDILKSNNLKPSQKILLFGPPGCGKTLAAEVLSSSLVYPMVYIRIGGLISSNFGETSANLGKIFDFIATGEWLVFFDDLDIIGRRRDVFSHQEEFSCLVNNFQQMMDNYKGDSLIICATNYGHLLDDALWQEFDEIIYLGLPTVKYLMEIFKKQFRSVKTYEMDYEALAEKTFGMTPDDVEKICQNTMKKMILEGKDLISTEDLEASIEKQKDRLKKIEQLEKDGV